MDGDELGRTLLTCQDGDVNLVFVSGRPALDFVGTLKWRRSENAEEQLTEPALLSDWAQGAGLVNEPLSVNSGDLAQAIELRESLYRIVYARLSVHPANDADLDLVNSHAHRLPVAAQLLRDGRVRQWASPPQLLASVALDLLDLLAGTDANRLRECSNALCTRLYIDASRSHNRRWCGMTECGNRAKAQSFRKRHKAPTTTTSR